MDAAPLRGLRAARRRVAAGVAGALAVACSVAGLGCSSAPGPTGAGAGPYAAGTSTFHAAGTTVQVWYPALPASTKGVSRQTYDVRDWLPPALADRVEVGRFTFTTDGYPDVAVAPGHRFRLVLFAHGLYSFRDQSTFLTTWLASRGYVVAAPEFPAHDLTAYFNGLLGDPPRDPPDDLAVLAATEQAVFARFAGRIETSKVAAIGHSLGGIDILWFASRPEVATYIALAAGFLRPHPPLAPAPSMYMAGELDRDIPAGYVKAVYDSAPRPKHLVVLPKAGHLAFTDLCLINPDAGGLAAIAPELHLDLAPGAPFVGRALDGCGPGYLSPGAGYSRIRAAVLAQLRRSLPAPATLNG